MTQNGKILFFNEYDGKGIIISTTREKIEFTVQDWDDYDNMPSLGLEVYFKTKKNTAFDIVSKSTFDTMDEENIKEADVKPDLLELEEDSIDEDFDKVTLRSDIESDEDAQINTDEEESDEYDVDEEESDEYDVDDSEITQELEEIVKQANEEENKFEDSLEDFKNYIDKENGLSGSEREEISHQEILDEIEKSKIIENKSNTKNNGKEQEEEQEEQEEVEEEREERPDNITISLNINTAVSTYFDKINKEIEKRVSYKKVNGKIDYLLAKRFLLTTFNNLTDLDLHIITPKIKMLHKDLKEMSLVYDDFENKTRYPHLAFKEVFLTCQDEYSKIKNGAEYTIEKLTQLRGNEKVLNADLQVKKEELSKNIDSREFDALEHELKSLNGAYVDIVHMMAELDEKYKEDMELLNKFEDEYREDFYEKFDAESIFYKKKLLDILDAQAYIFDSQLWLQARKSKSIKTHFKKSSIDGGLNTKTYLKYYLESQDAAKATEDTKKLYKLYSHLLIVQKDYVLIVVNSVTDAMDYEAAIKQSNKSLNIKSFVNPKSALKWALTHSIKVLIIEDLLQRVQIEKFLYIYEKNIFLKPKIILLGNKPKKSPYSISRLLSKGVSPKVIADSVKIVTAE